MIVFHVQVFMSMSLLRQMYAISKTTSFILLACLHTSFMCTLYVELKQAGCGRFLQPGTDRQNSSSAAPVMALE